MRTKVKALRLPRFFVENGHTKKMQTSAKSKKSILLEMIDHANSKGENIYPSPQTIADHTGLYVRSVKRGLLELRKLGLIHEQDSPPPAYYQLYPRADHRSKCWCIDLAGLDSRLRDGNLPPREAGHGRAINPARGGNSSRHGRAINPARGGKLPPYPFIEEDFKEEARKDAEAASKPAAPSADLKSKELDPRIKRVASAIYRSDEIRFARLIAWIKKREGENYPSEVIAGALEAFFEHEKKVKVRDWWPYLDRILTKLFGSWNEEQADKHKRDDAKFIAGLVGGLSRAMH